MGEKTIYEVFLNGGRWHVTTDGGRRKWGDFATRDLAVEEAKELAKTTLPSEVVVREEDGSVTKEYRHRRNPIRHP